MWSIVYAYLGAFIRWLFSFGKRRFKDILDVPKDKTGSVDPVDVMSNELVNLILGFLLFVALMLFTKWLLDGSTGL